MMAPLTTVRMGRERKRCAAVGLICSGNAENGVLSVKCQLCAKSTSVWVHRAVGLGSKT